MKELKYYWRQAIHILIFAVASMLSFNETVYQFSIYYGAKSLNDKQAVKATKNWLIVASITKAVSCFIIGFWAFTKHRRLTLLTSHFLSLLFIALIGLSFFIQDLRLSRLVLAMFPMTTSGVYTVNFLYANDVCRPALFSLNQFINRGLPGLFGILIPVFLRFEELSYQQVAYRIWGLVAVGLCCFVWLYFFMIETSGLSKLEIARYFKSGNLEEKHPKKEEGIDLISQNEYRALEKDNF